MKCYEEILVIEYLNLKEKMIEFSIRDLEEISLILINLNKDESIEWGLHEKTQSFNIGFWSKLEGVHQLCGRPVRTSTFTNTTTIPSSHLPKNSTQYEYKISIFKTDDDWFLVEIFTKNMNSFRHNDEGFWLKIDQIDGLVEFLENLFHVCPPFDFKRIESILDEIISKNVENNNNRYLSYMFNINPHHQDDIWLPVAGGNHGNVGIQGNQGLQGLQGIQGIQGWQEPGEPAQVQRFVIPINTL